MTTSSITTPMLDKHILHWCQPAMTATLGIERELQQLGEVLTAGYQQPSHRHQGTSTQVTLQAYARTVVIFTVNSLVNLAVQTVNKYTKL